MPDRYWVGGTASWDGTPSTKWATTSGGTGGAPIPGPNDDVFFDAASTGTVTIAAINNGAKSINCTGFTGTITGTGGLTVSGSITLSAGMTYTHTGTITINATATLTTAGKAFSALTIDGTGITVTLGDALNMVNRAIILTQGTLTTNNFTVTCGTISTNNTNTRTINLGSSTLNINIFQAANSTNLTFNAGTSQINLTSAGSFINVGTTAGSGATFHNVSFTAAFTSTDGRTIFGSHTFNNLTIDNTDTNARKPLVFSADQTVNGTLTCAGSSIFRRVFLRSSIPGITRTITAAAISADNCDFSSITIAGAAAGASPTNAGNCGGNSGLTFPAAKTVYRVGGNTSWSGVNSWALSSGGAGADANFPLPQDTAIIDNSATTGITLQIEPYNIGTLDASARTNAITFSGNVVANVCGSFVLGSGVTYSATGFFIFIGSGTSTITSAGKTITSAIEFLNTAGTFSLGDALNIGASSLTLTAGTFTTNNFNFTGGNISTSNANSRTINFGSSTINLSGFSGILATTATNLTFNAGTSQINLTSSSASLSFGTNTGITFYNVSFTSTATGGHQLLGGFIFNNLTFAAPATTGLRDVFFNADQTVNGTLTCAGASAVRRVSLTSTTDAVRTLTVASISANDCDFCSITLAGAAAGAAPTRAGDCGGNSGIVFPAPKTVYRVGTATNWGDANSWALSSGGTGLTDNFPLPQDTAVIDNATALAGTLAMGAGFNMGTLNMAARTNALTINHNSTTSVVGSYIVGSGITFTGTSGVNFNARSGFAEFTSAGKTITFIINISTFGATFRLLDALTSNNTLTLIAGTFNFNGFNVTCSGFTLGGANQRTFNLGSSTLTITGTGGFSNATLTNLTMSGSGTISLTSASAKTFNGGGGTYPYTINNGGAGALTMQGSNTITTLSNTVQPTTFTFASGTTTTLTNWNISGTAGNLVTINSVNIGTNTTPPILSKSSGTVSANYLAITFSNATGGASWYAGPNSVDNGVNSGWIFAAASAVIAAMAASEIGLDIFAALVTIGSSPQPVPGDIYRIELRSFTERRRF